MWFGWILTPGGQGLPWARERVRDWLLYRSQTLKVAQGRVRSFKKFGEASALAEKGAAEKAGKGESEPELFFSLLPPLSLLHPRVALS